MTEGRRRSSGLSKHLLALLTAGLVWGGASTGQASEHQRHGATASKSDALRRSGGPDGKLAPTRSPRRGERVVIAHAKPAKAPALDPVILARPLTLPAATKTASATTCKPPPSDPSSLPTDPARLSLLQRLMMESLAKTVPTTAAVVEGKRLTPAPEIKAATAAAKWRAGVGGPYIAPGGRRGRGGGLAAALASLNVHIDRQDELQQVIQSLPLAAPLHEYLVFSPFGPRFDSLLHRPAVHEGVDLAAPYGAPVEATAAGQVVFAGVHPGGYGRVVEVDHGRDVHTVYAHLSAVLVQVGQRVAPGQEIGRLGSSGRTTGPHLHYEVRVAGVPRDPAQFLDIGRRILEAERAAPQQAVAPSGR